MDLLQLQYFRTIAQTENLTKASQLLFVTQPNLSASITRLEDDLGVALFNRRKGKIVLTPTGRIFLDYVDGMLKGLDAVIGQVRAGDNIAKNHIRVAGSIIDLMNDILLQYYSDQTDLYFKQINCPNAEVAGKVLSEEVDFGFVFGIPASVDLEYLVMDSCVRVAVFSQQHRLAGRSGLSLESLSDEPMIINRARDDDELFRELAVRQGFHANVCYDINDTQTEVNLLLAGRGVCISPLTNFIKLMRNDPKLPLTFARLTDQLPPVQIGMIRRRDCRLSDAAFQFYRHVDEFFAEENKRTAAFLHDIATLQQ